jgi:hypothetical protein
MLSSAAYLHCSLISFYMQKFIQLLYIIYRKFFSVSQYFFFNT